MKTDLVRIICLYFSWPYHNEQLLLPPLLSRLGYESYRQILTASVVNTYLYYSTFESSNILTFFNLLDFHHLSVHTSFIIMSEALGFIMNALGLLVPLGLQAQYAVEATKEATSVQIIAGGGGGSTGGNVPHIALWDNEGHRIGQNHAASWDKINDGEVRAISVEHNQNGGKQADPYY